MKLRRATTIVLGLLCLMYLITYVDRVNIATAAADIQRELHLSNTQLGLVFSAFAYPYLLFQVFGGWVGDRFGPRFTLFTCGVDLGHRDDSDRPRHEPDDALHDSRAARRRRRRDVPGGDARDAELDAGGAARVRAGHHARVRAIRQRGHAAARRVADRSSSPGAARSSCSAAAAWSGSSIWVLYFRDNPAEHRGITAEELDELPNRGVRRDDRSSRCALEAADAADAARHDRLLLLRLDALAVPELAAVVLPATSTSSTSRSRRCSRRPCSSPASAATFSAASISDRILERTGDLRKARRNVVMTGFLGAFVCLLPMFLTRDLTLITLSLAAGFFFAEIVIGPMWAIPMDIAPKYSGTASGLMNTGSAAAAILSPLAFGYIADVTGNWHLPFAGSLALLLTGALLTPTMKPERPFDA